MTERDERVGQAVVALRGEAPQSLIAHEMRRRGWKWSQATVWSVEKGERPLRLLEASDLAEILGVHIDDFFGDRAAARQEAEFRRLQTLIHLQYRDIREATKRLLAAKDQMRQWAEAQGIPVPKDYDEAQQYPKHGREQELHHSLNWKDAGEAVVEGTRLYERFKQEGSDPRTNGMGRIMEEVQGGKHSETS